MGIDLERMTARVAAALKPGDVCSVDLQKALRVLRDHPLGGMHLLEQVKDVARKGGGKVVVQDTFDMEHGTGPGEKMVFVAPAGQPGDHTGQDMVDMPVSALKKVASVTAASLSEYRREIDSLAAEWAGHRVKDVVDEAKELAFDYAERRQRDFSEGAVPVVKLENEYYQTALRTFSSIVLNESRGRVAAARTAARWYVRMKSGNWGYQDASNKKQAMEQAEEDWGKKEGKADYAERVEGKELRSSEPAMEFPRGEGPRVAAEKRIDVLRRILDQHQYEKIDGMIVDATTANMLVLVYETLDKSGNNDMSKFDRIPMRKLVDFGWRHVKAASDTNVPAGDDYVGSPKTHGIEEPRGGGFSIMQDLQKSLVKEQKKTTGAPVKTAELKSRRAMYWGGPDRVYRLTKGEQENGVAVCPKCKAEMEKEPFTKGERMWVCPECRFKVPTGKTTTTRVTIDVDKETGEVDVDVTNASRRGSKVSFEG